MFGLDVDGFHRGPLGRSADARSKEGVVLIDPWRGGRPPGGTGLQRVPGPVRRGAALWQRYGWLRAGLFLDAVESARARRPEGTESLTSHAWVEGWTQSTVRRVLDRTCGTVFSRRPVPEEARDAVMEIIRHRAAAWPYLLVGLAAQTLDGLEMGTYRPSASGADAMEYTGELDTVELLRVCQGQRWIEGGGGVLFLGLSWAPLERCLGDGPDAYAEGMIRIGILGQELVQRLTLLEMKARMTPAIIESRAAHLFGLDEDDGDLLYLLKFGYPG